MSPEQEAVAYLATLFDVDAGTATEVLEDLKLILAGDTTSTRFMEGPYND
jgi:hypothetical protein